MISPPKATTPPKVQRVPNKDWLKGTVTAYDSGRTPVGGLESSSNTILDQDGTVRPRPSLRKYGPQPIGTILGQIYEYKIQDGLDATQWMISLQKITQNEKQTVSITGSPTGGTFTLTFSGQTTASIAYNASAANVQSALEALSNIAVGDVTCTGGSLPGTAIVIEFKATYANTDVPALTFTKSLTGGTSPNVVITETLKGGYTAYAHIAKGEDTTWTKCTGATYSITASARFCQIQDKVLIMNGSDNLSYFDVTTSDSTPTVTRYTAITTPSAPTGTVSTGLAGTGFNVYYAVTANSTVGETDGSTALTKAIKTDRDLWDPTTQYVDVAWTTVTGVQSWNLYMGVSADGSGIPKLYLIASGLDAATLTFRDDGSRAQDLTRPIPANNSTAGPKLSRAEVINGRVWGVGDSDNPYYAWRGGDYGFELDFSPSNGGGFSPIGNGSKEIPIAVKPFRDGKGDPKVTVLSKGTNGYGKRFILAPTTVTYGGSSFVVWEVQEDSGQDGTDSPDGVIIDGTSLYYPSRDGFKTTGTKPQLQNVLSTDRISNTIQTDISRLNTAKMPLCVGLSYEGRLYWSLPVSSNMNNEIWVLDISRGGAWMKPWSVSADWMWLYNDNSGLTHFCIIEDNVIYEFTNNQFTNDAGTAFITDGNSGINYFSDDQREWAKIINVVFTVLRPQGNLSFTVTCETDDGTATFIGGGSYGVDTNVVGWGEPSTKGIIGWGRHGWSEVETVPVASGVASTDIIVEVDEEAKWWKYGWSSSGTGANYQLSNVVPEFVTVGIKDLS